MEFLPAESETNFLLARYKSSEDPIKEKRLSKRTWCNLKLSDLGVLGCP